MSEVEKLRGDVAELREAVVILAAFAESADWALRHIPKGDTLAQHPERVYSSLVHLLYMLGGIPPNSHPPTVLPQWLAARIVQARNEAHRKSLESGKS